jgi:hypothetical protein
MEAAAHLRAVQGAALGAPVPALFLGVALTRGGEFDEGARVLSELLEDIRLRLLSEQTPDDGVGGEVGGEWRLGTIYALGRWALALNYAERGVRLSTPVGCSTRPWPSFPHRRIPSCVRSASRRSSTAVVGSRTSRAARSRPPPRSAARLRSLPTPRRTCTLRSRFRVRSGPPLLVPRGRA